MRRRCSTYPSVPVIDAREALRKAMHDGNSAKIETAYKQLESADKIARARRAAAHACKVVARVLPERLFKKD